MTVADRQVVKAGVAEIKMMDKDKKLICEIYLTLETRLVEFKNVYGNVLAPKFPDDFIVKNGVK